MSIRQRPPIRFGFQTKNTSLASATRNDFAAITLYQPMTASPTFKSVYLRVWGRIDETTAKDLTSRLIGIKLGAAAFDDQTVTDTIANSGTHGSFYFTRDVTAYFIANWTSGASKTCQVGLQFGGVATINLTVEVVIVFDADDSNNTRIRTVEIPIESGVTTLTNALTELGTNQIPILTGGSGLLPEASITIRDWYIRVEGNEAARAGTTNYALGLQIDADAEHVGGTFRQNLASSCAFGYIYSRNGSVPTTTAAHAFKARSNNLTDRITFSAVMVVTYEYDHGASTRVLNSLVLPMIPLEAKHQASPGDATDVQRFAITLPIGEPGTLTLLQSGVLAHFGGAGAAADWTLSMKVGAQASARSYTVPATGGATWCGGLAVAHRVDAGGAQGLAFTLVRGRNVFTFDHYNSIGDGSVPQPLLYLNYSSDVHANGDSAHTHTVAKLLQDSSPVAADVITSAAVAPVLPEAAVAYVHVGFVSVPLVNSPAQAALWQAEVLAGEAASKGWVEIMGGVHLSNPSNRKLGFFVCCGHGGPQFTRWTGDPDAQRLDVQAARRWRLADGFNPTSSLVMLLTYHSMDATGLFYAKDWPTGDGSGIPCALYDSGTGELLLVGLTDPGGTWRPVWMEHTRTVFARQIISGNYRATSNDLII